MAGILKVDQYQDFNGNNIMTSDGAGNLTINNDALKMTPMFAATGASNAISADTYVKAQNGTELYDTDGDYGFALCMKQPHVSCTMEIQAGNAVLK